MKVLHLPFNVASQISVTVRALRDMGVAARGLALSSAAIQDGAGIECLKETVSRRSHPIRGTLEILARRRAVLEAVRWADVVHWHVSWALPKARDVRHANRLGRARIVEFWGTDIRVPRIAAADNPYAAKMYRDYPELADGAEESSLACQREFARYGVACLIPGVELGAYVAPELFPSRFQTRPRLLLQEFQPEYPVPDRPRPLVIHAPSHTAKKGTECVLRVVEQLQRTHTFDFRLVQGVPRSEALQLLRSCDVYLDQFVLGDHGLATLEAMALGKPAVCYIKPSLVAEYPPDCPIVNANQDNLAQVLAQLLENGQRRHELGRRSRAYAERYHDARQVAARLVEIYSELLSKAPRQEKT